MRGRVRVGRRLGFVLLSGLVALPLAAADFAVTATQAGAAATFFDDVQVSTVPSLTVGPNGGLWFLTQDNSCTGCAFSDSLARLEPDDGTFTVFHNSEGKFVGTDIVAVPGGELWFNGGNRIGRSMTDGEVFTYTNSTLTATQLTDLTPGPDDAIWFTTADDHVGKITTSGTISTYTSAKISQPTSIVAGPDGALWFTNSGNNSIGRVTTSGVVTNFTSPKIDNPNNIVSGPGNALWFGSGHPNNVDFVRMNASGVVTAKYSTTIASTGIQQVTAGSDGAIWFTDGPKIERMATNGVVASYTDAKSSSAGNPNAITTGPDGAIWFGHAGSSGWIGRITTNTPPDTSSCGTGCVKGTALPGIPVASLAGQPTDAKPTKQVVTLPANDPSAPPVSITLKSIKSTAKLAGPDKALCPNPTTCSGQISAITGSFGHYVDKAHPATVQIVAKWKPKVPAGKLYVATSGAAKKLAACKLSGGKYNTPCLKSEVVKGTITTDTILFVGSAPHVARRRS